MGKIYIYNYFCNQRPDTLPEHLMSIVMTANYDGCSSFMLICTVIGKSIPKFTSAPLTIPPINTL